MEKEQANRESVAVFFDYENIVYSLKNRFEQKTNFEALIDKCKELGSVVAAQAFADWSLPHISPALLYALQSSGFDLIFVPTGSTQVNAPRKNVADLYMAIHVMEALHTRPEVSTFVLLTGDRDFMPLVNTLQRYGKRVVAIGVDGSSSYYLTQAVDDFFYYSEVEEIFEDAPKRSKGRLTNIYDALIQTIKILQEKGKPATLAHLKPQMAELLGGFDESQYMDSTGRPFQKFKDFIMEARRRGMVQVVPRGAGMEVIINNKPTGWPAVVTRHESPEAAVEGGPLTLEEAFDLLVRVVQRAQTEGKSFRASSIKNLITRVHPGFSETDIEDGNKRYSRFSDFVRDAAKQELVEVRGAGPKMEIRPRRDMPPAHLPNNTSQKDEEILYQEGDIRHVMLDSLRRYRHYPVSFLSLASHSHKWFERQNINLDVTMTRTLLTETVELGLLVQSRRHDGKRQYSYQDNNELINQFLDVAVGNTPDLTPLQDTGLADETDIPDLPTAPIRSINTTPKLSAEQDIVDDHLDKTTQSVPEAKFVDYKPISENEEKQLIVDALRTCSIYPAPFMGILAHCRTVRDEKEVYLPNGLLRELLSTASKVGLLRTISSRNERPAQYDFFDSDEAVRAFIGGQSINVEARDRVLNEVDEEKKAVSEPAATPMSNKISQTVVTIAEPEVIVPPVDEAAARQLLIDSLRSYDNYPIPFMKVLSHVCSVRDEQTSPVNTENLRSLLSTIIRLGILEVTSPRGIRPTLYTFSEDNDQIATYLTPHIASDEKEVDKQTPVEPKLSVDPINDDVDDAPELSSDLAESSSTEDAFQLLVTAVQTLMDNEKSTIFRSVKQAMRKVDNDFNEKNLMDVNGKPYKRFKDFVFAAVAAGVITVDESGKSPRVHLPVAVVDTTMQAKTEEVEADEDDTETIAPDLLTTSESNVADNDYQSADVAEDNPLTLDDAFSLLKQAVQAATDEEGTHRLASIRSRMVKINPAFDIKTIVLDDGHSFSKLSDFIRAAAEAGHVEIQGKGFSLEAHPITND